MFYFVTSFQLDCPVIDLIVLPLRPCPVAHPFLPVLHRHHVFSVDCCVLLVVSALEDHNQIYFLNFCRLIRRPQRREIVSPNIPPWLNLVIHLNPSLTLSFSWLSCVSPSFGGCLQPRILFFIAFFVAQIAILNDR